MVDLSLTNALNARRYWRNFRICQRERDRDRDRDSETDRDEERERERERERLKLTLYSAKRQISVYDFSKDKKTNWP